MDKYAKILNHEVSSFEIDYKGTLKLDEVFKLLQHSATLSATELGVGRDELINYDTAWVLSRISLNVYNLPKETDKIKIVTWPTKQMFTFHPRHFEVFDREDNLILESNTVWTLLDINKRNMSSLDLDKLGYPSDLTKPSKPLPKKVDASEINYVKTYIPTYSDLDVNQHVNNTKYVTWMFDLLPLEVIDNIKVKNVLTNYLHEIRKNDEVKMGYIRKENFYYFAFKVNENICFMASIEVEE